MLWIYSILAGATSSLWLGFFDDMAQLNSNDPIERESTRVSLVVGIAAAHTMNLNKWKEMLNIDQDYMDKLVSQYIGKLDIILKWSLVMRDSHIVNFNLESLKSNTINFKLTSPNGLT